ncbi:hypothetical protein [Streptomyces sp. NPDC017890]|uniref:hypothetical protein n=1 Tax=Streptomyces sp. NPDC017890 TaxID=3365015 RepID=UPI0037AEA387
MAVTVGLVQQLSIISPTGACVWVGPRVNNAEVLYVTNDGSVADAAFAANLIQTFAAAAANYRAVSVTHNDDDGKVTMLQVEPV